MARAVATGLNIMSSASRHPGMLVIDHADSGSAKARRANDEGVPAIGERTFLTLLREERTLLLAELCRRGPLWRFRAVGQGHDHGLEALARGYGVDVE